jgi:peptidoglycan/LPS O-acetylase OafA/YrhL
MRQPRSVGARPEPLRIPSLDGWRGIAILLVISEHLQLGMLGRLPLHTGLHGVTLFFVLSGYLITRKLLTEERMTGTINLSGFYRRRFRRLMPAAWAYLIVLLAIMLIGRVRIRPVDFVSALLFFRNYVDPRGLTGHFWSLSIEEQFYLIWPLLLCRLNRRMAVVGTLGGACFLAAWRFSGFSGSFPHAGWQALHTEFQADALLVGCAAALLGPGLQRYLRSWMVWPLSGTLLLLIAFKPLPVSLFESVVIAFLLLITSQLSGTILDLNPLRTIGLLSYSLYVWQQPFLMTRFKSLLDMCAHVAVLIGCATLSWWLLEPHPRGPGITDLVLSPGPASLPTP